MNILNNLYIHLRFFIITGVIIFTFAISFAFPILFPVAKTILILFIVIILLDGVLLFDRKHRLSVERRVSKIMSLNNENHISLFIKNDSNMEFRVLLIDELPFQLQERNNSFEFLIRKNENKTINYKIVPKQRGEYCFGKAHIYLTSNISLLQRRISSNIEQNIPVYPSIIDLKKFELQTTSKLSTYLGIKKVRRIGQSYEFEQISEFHQGDNYQHMNWKASSRVNRLMINRFTEEKSQPVYCFIDKSRYMKMPFHELSLLDYSINASLIIANTALNKDDKAGLLTFSNKIETLIKADNKRTQIQGILHALYKETETKMEANYELMYSQVRQSIVGRSLIFLFSNFDTVFALERVLPILRKLNKIHLLVVIVFENTELEDFYKSETKSTLDIYNQTIARKIAYEKKQVISILKQHAIQVMYTKPEELSLNTLNKYLELKSRGII